jgi:hypothetical protein
MFNVCRRGVALVWLAGCGGSLHGGGGQAGGGGSVSIGPAGAAGDSGQCPRAPATNDPECHPEDSGLWSVGYPVPALGGECTPGLTCEIPVGVNNDCALALGLQTFVCCPAIFPNVVVDSLAPMHGGFVPGGTTAACPQPVADQDPACALPLTGACAVDGLTCSYRSVFGAGSDAGCFQCSTHEYRVRCCGGVWTLGETCPADAGMGVD